MKVFVMWLVNCVLVFGALQFAYWLGKKKSLSVKERLAGMLNAGLEEAITRRDVHDLLGEAFGDPKMAEWSRKQSKAMQDYYRGINGLKPESVPGPIPPDLGSSLVAGESEATGVKLVATVDCQRHGTYSYRVEIPDLVLECIKCQSVHLIHSTQTDSRPESPEKQTSSLKTATQPDTHAGKRTVLYRAPRDVDAVHERQTRNGSWEGWEETDTLEARAIETCGEALEIVRQVQKKIQAAQDNQTNDPPRPLQVS